MYTLDLSIILPSYNEEKNIIETLKKLDRSLKINKIKKYELIFVDDGSTDNTKKIINKYIVSNKKKNIK